MKRDKFPSSLVVHDTRSLTIREKCKLRVFKNRVLRKIPGTNRQKATAD
jgi:hypothetical protein